MYISVSWSALASRYVVGIAAQVGSTVYVIDVLVREDVSHLKLL